MDCKLILKRPSQAQIQETWKNTCQEWGRGVSFEQYSEREVLLGTCPFTSSNMDTWVLVPEDDQDTLDLRSHVEVIYRPAYVKRNVLSTEKVGTVLTVFTPPAHRKNGYAKLMLAKLCDVMRQEADGSILFSDIGKFYEQFGFKLFSPFHTVFPACKLESPSTHIQLLQEENLKEISAMDCELVRSELKENTLVIEPSFEVYHWHILRSHFYAKYTGHAIPEIFGARASGTHESDLQFLVWANDYNEKKTVILRHRLGNKASELLKAAQDYAHATGMTSVLGWNLDTTLLANSEITGKIEVVERDTDSLPYLQYFKGCVDLDWKNVQKYTWA